jgi:ferredoxin
VLNIGADLKIAAVADERPPGARWPAPEATARDPPEEINFMTYVVAEPCVNCRYTDCALVCPVEAFHLDDDMLVINPETCIDCDACVPECPVEAIFPEDKVPEEWAHFTQMNAERALSGLPTISDKLDPLC